MMSKKVNFRLIVIGLFAVLIIIYVLDSNSLIKDSNFRKCIKHSLENYTVCDNKINKENIGHLGTLDIDNDIYNVKDIDGIKYFGWLYKLIIDQTDKIANIQQISQLNKLKHLYIIDCNVKYTLNEIKSNSVTFLHIRNMDLKEAENISTHFPNLEILSCWYSKIFDFSLIKNSKSLTSLDIVYSTINSLDGIETLDNLKNISLHNCTINKADKDKLDALDNINIDLSDTEIINN